MTVRNPSLEKASDYLRNALAACYAQEAKMEITRYTDGAGEVQITFTWSTPEPQTDPELVRPPKEPGKGVHVDTKA